MDTRDELYMHTRYGIMCKEIENYIDSIIDDFTKNTVLLVNIQNHFK